jgi:hypothetical protein
VLHRAQHVHRPLLLLAPCQGCSPAVLGAQAIFRATWPCASCCCSSWDALARRPPPRCSCCRSALALTQHTSSSRWPPLLRSPTVALLVGKSSSKVLGYLCTGQSSLRPRQPVCDLVAACVLEGARLRKFPSVLWRKAAAHAELLCGQAEGLPPVRCFDVDFRPVTQQKAATIAAVPDLRDRLGAGAEVAPEAGARAPSGGQLSAHACSGSVQAHGGSVGTAARSDRASA